MQFPNLKIFVTLAIFLQVLTIGSAQPIAIPETMYFAGMKLHLSKGARKIVEKDYVSITKNSRYFASLIQRADLYFPIIEQVFKEENAPPDFKFLALQESSLQSDVVSKSNAVGYWQFKKESAQEVGLQVDSDIDERKNVVASSQGAAKYLKKGNAILNNWVYTLLAYYLGRGGVMPYVKDKYRNSNEMDIGEDMNWYVLRFLAHKYAYESKVGLVPHPQLRLALYNNGNGKTLKEISEEKSLDLVELENYNKWLAVHKIPNGRTYTVILPFKITQDISGENVVIADNTTSPPLVDKPIAASTRSKKKYKPTNKEIKESLGFDPLDLPLVVDHNKLRAVQARTKDSFAKLAYAGNIPVTQFLRHNELESFDNILLGQLYYLEPKRNKALVMFHTVKAGETLWSISQMYGIRMASIRKKNRMKMKENIYVGQVLSLREKISKEQKNKPQNTPLFMKTQEIEVAKPEPTPSPSAPKVEETTYSPEERPIINSSQESTSESPVESPAESPKVTNQTTTTTSQSSNTIVVDTREDKTEPVIVEEKALPIPPTQTSPEVTEKPLPIPTTRTSPDVAAKPSPTPPTRTSPDVAAKPSPTPTTQTSPDVASKPSPAPTAQTSPDVIKSSGLNDSLQLHTVVAGQTLYNISKTFSVSIDSLKNWNKLQTNEISIGQALIVKKSIVMSAKNPDNTKTYTVKMGDTVYKIARENGVSVEDILLWNNKATMILSIGEKVLIKK